MKGMKKKSHFKYVKVLGSAVASAAVSMLSGCCGSMEQPSQDEAVSVSFIVEGSGDATKSRDPQENLLTDINLFIFNEAGLLEESRYLKKSELVTSYGGYGCEVTLLRNCRYSIYACANTGYSIPVHNIRDIMEYEYHLVYEDEYMIGIPMSGCRENVEVTGQKKIDIPLRRSMAKISVCIDRSRLYNDVKFFVRSIRVGGCPKKVRLFEESRISSKDEAFIVGFMKNGLEAEALNTTVQNRKSKEISLFMFENMQGNQLYGAGSYKEKYFDSDDPRADICPYIELKIDYLSSTLHSEPGKYLIYRFYLGDNPCNFDVRRNTHYHITVLPEGDGLQGDGWRVDKTAIISS